MFYWHWEIQFWIAGHAGHEHTTSDSSHVTTPYNLSFYYYYYYTVSVDSVSLMEIADIIFAMSFSRFIAPART